MLRYILRRLLLTLPTLFAIALAIFLLLDLAPGDPMAQLPMSISSETRAEMREVLGLDQPSHVRFGKWVYQLIIIEPLVAWDAVTGTTLSDGLPRITSWQSHGPVMALIAERLPQTLWVVGMAYVIGCLVAIPVGILSAYRQHSLIDHAGTALTMLGYAVPSFFLALLLILIFAVRLEWVPTLYDTTHRVTDWVSLKTQIAQMILPVMVLSIQTTAQIGRYMRAAILDQLGQDFVRTARAKGLRERTVVLGHVLRHAMTPVVTVVALGIPQIFGGAIITEQIFGVNGLGQLLITSLLTGDMPVVLTITLFMAALIVLTNLLADVLYGWLDPRVQYA
jgi:peptide/nickel transport system permease protein